MEKIKEFKLPVDFKFVTDKLEKSTDSKEQDGKFIVEGYASTDCIDRQDEVITREALKAAEKDLEKNCTVFYEHKHADYPIGRVLMSRLDEKGLFIRVMISKKADKVWELIKEGILRCFSIGGRVLDAVERFDEKLKRKIIEIRKLELLEVSLVGIPANPEAKVIGWQIAKALYGGEKMKKEINEPLSEEDYKEKDKEKVEETATEEEKKETKEEVVEEKKKEKEEDTEKVKWDVAYINDLPDSAFAVIEPAYKRGETEDKRARHLPHHKGSGDLGGEASDANLDLPHYRNALARVNQIKPVTDSISTEDLRKKAQTHLERHRDALKESEEVDEKKDEKEIEEKADEKKEVKIKIKVDTSEALKKLEEVKEKAREVRKVIEKVKEKKEEEVVEEERGEEEVEKKVCPECGYEGEEDECPDCGAEMKEEKKEEGNGKKAEDHYESYYEDYGKKKPDETECSYYVDDEMQKELETLKAEVASLKETVNQLKEETVATKDLIKAIVNQMLIDWGLEKNSIENKEEEVEEKKEDKVKEKKEKKIEEKKLEKKEEKKENRKGFIVESPYDEVKKTPEELKKEKEKRGEKFWYGSVFGKNR